MQFPYAISDFYKLITNNYLYIDRTDHIPLIEEVGQYLLFLRPRRFGKSLLLSMLKNYYDVAKADDFERLFGQLAIAQQPTPHHNQYFVLEWDFSLINPQSEAAEIQQSLYEYINQTIRKFARYYQNLLDDEIIINPTNALVSFQSLLAAVQYTPYQLYLLIDEYDNFANEVMMSQGQLDPTRYKALVQGEGCLKAIFKVIKGATKGGGLDRTFITGVAPVVMSDIISGHNIAESIYLEPEFNHLCGFKEAEIEVVLQQIAQNCNFEVTKAKQALTMMRTFYNGYAFTYDTPPTVYNPTLALYFLKHFQKRCQYPHRILDSNLAMDKGKINYIAQLPYGEQVVLSLLNDKDVINIDELADDFGVEEMLHKVKDSNFMISLLYYFGMLTLNGERTAIGSLVLKIPNLVARRLYVERIQDMLLPQFELIEKTQQVARQFYQTANMQTLCDFLVQGPLKVFDNRDYLWTDELTIKTVFLSILFNDSFYIMDSETPLERTYADLTMIIRPDMRQYKLLDFLLEFKYIKLSDLEISGTDLKEKSTAQLKALEPVKTKLTEAKTQLRTYREILQKTYSNKLHLRVFSIIALGYERLLWEEV